jgi:hypothetical protein
MISHCIIIIFIVIRITKSRCSHKQLTSDVNCIYEHVRSDIGVTSIIFVIIILMKAIQIKDV